MTRLNVSLGGKKFEVTLGHIPPGESEMTVTVDGRPVRVVIPGRTPDFDDLTWLMVGDRPLELSIDPDLGWLGFQHLRLSLEIRDLDAPVHRPPSGDKRVKAPIPGLITRLPVQPGQAVQTGDPVAVLEAMKMENELSATASGVIEKVHAVVGQTVRQGEVLIEIS